MNFRGTQITDFFAEKLSGALPAGFQQLTMCFRSTQITDVFADKWIAA